MNRASTFAILSFSMLFPTAAEASPIYPDVLAAELELSCPPVCTLCHDTMEGGVLTANQPFGAAVRLFGLVANNPQQLREVIARLEANGRDSDGDGQGDVAEVRAGTNPNEQGSAPLDCYTPPPPEDEGGCAMGHPGHSGRAGDAVLLSLALLFAGTRALRRRGSQSARRPR